MGKRTVITKPLKDCINGFSLLLTCQNGQIWILREVGQPSHVKIFFGKTSRVQNHWLINQNGPWSQLTNIKEGYLTDGVFREITVANFAEMLFALAPKHEECKLHEGIVSDVLGQPFARAVEVYKKGINTFEVCGYSSEDIEWMAGDVLRRTLERVSLQHRTQRLDKIPPQSLKKMLVELQARCISANG
jgi:hypothetical protein